MTLAAAEPGAAPHPLAVAPFVLLLLAVAVLPLLARTHHWWEQNRNKLLVSGLLGLVTLGYYALSAGDLAGGASAAGAVLRHAVIDEYIPFLTLLFSLYVISGGIVLRGRLHGNPQTNTVLLAVGTLAASLVGTTGASMVLIRPLLIANARRRHVVHTYIFFIFLVSNIGGSLLPIGDPPLFLGFLRGVPFFWTLTLWKPWLPVCLALLALYLLWDRRAYAREAPEARSLDALPAEPLRLGGGINIAWLLLAVVSVALLTPGKTLPGTHWVIPPHVREGVLLALTGLSLATTPDGVRRDNRFNYVAIGEVACLFIGIFVTMQAPIELLKAHGAALASHGLTHPWQFFWMTGVLSSFLDNAPTYVVFFEIADSLTDTHGPGVLRLVNGTLLRTDLLTAISCGAVFMGANSYIGNGPNFMVKSIVEQAGVRMPSFLGYMAFAAVILGPLFLLLTLAFFL